MATADLADTLAALVNVAQSGFAYEPTKAIGAAVGWHLDVDEPDLGCVAFVVNVGIADDVCRLTVLLGEGARAILHLLASEQYGEDQRLFDADFTAVTERLNETLGSPFRSAAYHYAHRPEWDYGFAVWPGAGATFLLVQDEFDIQFGLDVTLWVFPPGVPVQPPVSAVNDAPDAFP